MFIKRAITSLLLFSLLVACSNLTRPEAALENLAVTCLGYSVVSSKDSGGTSTLNDGKIPALDQINDATTWHYRGDFNESTGFPMEVVLDLGGRYELDKLIYNVGRIVEPSKARLIVKVSDDKKFSGSETALTLSDKAYGAEVAKEVSGAGRYVRLSFKSNAQRFDISELRVCGEAAPTTPDTPTDGARYFNVLGMNYTFFHAEYPRALTTDSPRVSPVFEAGTVVEESTATVRSTEVAQHARWFLLNTKDYDGSTPATHKLDVCDLNYLYDESKCPDRSPGENMKRVLRLLEAHEGLVFLAPEGDNLWPGKFWNVEALSSPTHSALESGYEFADAYFQTLEYLPQQDQERVVLAMTNEEWSSDSGRKAAYDQWRIGFIQAHYEHASLRQGGVKLATGARQFDNRTELGLTESILDLENIELPQKLGGASTVLEYINNSGGYTSIHIHDRYAEDTEDSTAIFTGDVSQSYGVDQLRKMRQWLDARYPNIKIYVGELSFTNSKDGELPTLEERQSDAVILKDFVREASKYTGGAPVFLYQVNDHWPTPRCTSSETNVIGDNYAQVACKIRNYKKELVDYSNKWEGKFTGTNYGTDNDQMYDVVEDFIEFASETVE